MGSMDVGMGWLQTKGNLRVRDYWKNCEGSSMLSRESPISNPLPEELTKKDFKGSCPSPISGGRKKADPGAGHSINHHCPQPQKEASKLFCHRPCTAQLWTFPKDSRRRNSSLLSELQEKFSKHLSLLDLSSRAELGRGKKNVAPNLVL